MILLGLFFLVKNFVCRYYMDPRKRLPIPQGGALGVSSLRHKPLFGWESMKNFFKASPLEVRKEILNLETMEFQDRKYFYDSEIGGRSIKWVSNLGKFWRRRNHFLHSITHHHQTKMLLSMVIRDKKVDNYKLFTGQEEKKCIFWDIKYNLDGILVRLSHVECFVVSNSDTDSNDHQEDTKIINATPLNTVHRNPNLPLNNSDANASPCSSIIIFD